MHRCACVLLAHSKGGALRPAAAAGVARRLNAAPASLVQRQGRPALGTPHLAPMSTATEDKGFMDRIKNKVMGGTQEEKQAEAYREQVAIMTSKKDFTLVDFRTMLARIAEMAGASGWKSYLPGVSSQADVVEIKKMLNVVENLTPAELENPEKNLGRRWLPPLSLLYFLSFITPDLRSTLLSIYHRIVARLRPFPLLPPPSRKGAKLNSPNVQKSQCKISTKC